MPLENLITFCTYLFKLETVVHYDILIALTSKFDTRIRVWNRVIETAFSGAVNLVIVTVV